MKPNTVCLDLETYNRLKQLSERARQLESENEGLRAKINEFYQYKDKYDDLIKRGIVLSEQDSKTFMEALNNPPEPSKELKEAAERYKKAIGNKPMTKEQHDFLEQLLDSAE